MNSGQQYSAQFLKALKDLQEKAKQIQVDAIKFMPLNPPSQECESMFPSQCRKYEAKAYQKMEQISGVLTEDSILQKVEVCAIMFFVLYGKKKKISQFIAKSTRIMDQCEFATEEKKALVQKTFQAYFQKIEINFNDKEQTENLLQLILFTIEVANKESQKKQANTSKSFFLSLERIIEVLESTLEIKISVRIIQNASILIQYPVYEPIERRDVFILFSMTECTSTVYLQKYLQTLPFNQFNLNPQFQMNAVLEQKTIQFISLKEELCFLDYQTSQMKYGEKFIKCFEDENRFNSFDLGKVISVFCLKNILNQLYFVQRKTNQSSYSMAELIDSFLFDILIEEVQKRRTINQEFPKNDSFNQYQCIVMKWKQLRNIIESMFQILVSSKLQSIAFINRSKDSKNIQYFDGFIAKQPDGSFSLIFEECCDEIEEEYSTLSQFLILKSALNISKSSLKFEGMQSATNNQNFQYETYKFFAGNSDIQQQQVIYDPRNQGQDGGSQNGFINQVDISNPSQNLAQQQQRQQQVIQQQNQPPQSFKRIKWNKSDPQNQNPQANTQQVPVTQNLIKEEDLPEQISLHSDLVYLVKDWYSIKALFCLMNIKHYILFKSSFEGEYYQTSTINLINSPIFGYLLENFQNSTIKFQIYLKCDGISMDFYESLLTEISQKLKADNNHHFQVQQSNGDYQSFLQYNARITLPKEPSIRFIVDFNTSNNEQNSIKSQNNKIFCSVCTIRTPTVILKQMCRYCFVKNIQESF